MQSAPFQSRRDHDLLCRSVAAVPTPPGDAVMKEARVARIRNRAAELRRMAERAKEAERERKMRVLAEELEDDAARLEEALGHRR